MRDRRDGADDAEGSVLDKRDAVLATIRFGLEPLDAGNAIGDDGELLDLVRQPADLRLFEFLASKRLSLFGADLANAEPGFSAPF